MPTTIASPPDQVNRSTPDNSPDSEAWADWVFRCFVQVADAEPGLSVSDVEQLHTWTRKLGVDSTQRLAPVAQWLEGHYPALWKRHVAQGQALDPVLLQSQWWEQIRPHPMGGLLRKALTDLLTGCAQPRAGWLSMVASRQHASSGHQSERQARLQQLWQSLDNEPSAATTTAPLINVPPAPPTGTPAAANSTGAGSEGAPAPAPSRWQLRCVAITDETADMRTFIFRRLDGDIPPYAPGQFMTLELHTQAHGRLFRSYTMSSTPSRPHTVAISVKRLPGGRGSNWLHDNVQPGWEVQVRGPSGHFTCGRTGEPSLMLLLGAGSGMTPMMSMVRWLTDIGSTSDVALVQSARTEADVVFRDEWAHLARHSAGPRALHVVLGSSSPGGRRLDLDTLLACVPDVANRTAYLCGPQPYLDSVKSLLAQAGVPPEHVLEEQFAAAAPAPTPKPTHSASSAPQPRLSPPTANQATPTTVAVRFAKSDVTVQASVGDCLLEVAEANQIDLPSACRSGQCGTCWITLVSGEVQVGDEATTTHGDGLAEIATCISRVCKGPVTLDC